MNNAVLIGRIATDLELRGTENNRVVNFNLAVSRQGKKDETDFIPVTVFGKSAENLVQYQAKGSMIAVSGYIRQDNYKDKEGNNRNSFKVIASRVQFLSSKPTPEVSVASFSEDDDFQIINDDDIPF